MIMDVKFSGTWARFSDCFLLAVTSPQRGRMEFLGKFGIDTTTLSCSWRELRSWRPTYETTAVPISPNVGLSI